MSIRSFVLASPVLALTLVASSAFAQEAAPAPAAPAAAPSSATQFGDAGQFALSLNHGFRANQINLFNGESEIQGSYFVIPNLSLGLAVGAEYMSNSPANGGDADTNFMLHVGPRVGYNLRISDMVSFWPQAGVDYRRTDSTTHGTAPAAGETASSSTTVTSNAFGLTVLAPVLIHPTKGFFVGAGPEFNTDFTNSASMGGKSIDQAKTTSIGLVATIGGAF